MEYRIAIPASIYVTIEASTDEMAIAMARLLQEEWSEWDNSLARIDDDALANNVWDARVWPERGDVVIVDAFEPHGERS
jgi:hypothetical protein